MPGELCRSAARIEPEFACTHDGLGAVACLQRAQDGRDVDLHRALGQPEFARDQLVRLAAQERTLNRRALELRTTPLQRIVEPLPRMAREIAQRAGKRVEVEIRNADLAPHIVMLDLHEHSAVRIKHQFR